MDPAPIFTSYLLRTVRWYMKKGKYQHAYNSLLRLRNNPIQAARDLYYIHSQLELEAEIIGKNTYATRFVELFTIVSGYIILRQSALSNASNLTLHSRVCAVLPWLHLQWCSLSNFAVSMLLLFIHPPFFWTQELQRVSPFMLRLDLDWSTSYLLGQQYGLSIHMDVGAYCYLRSRTWHGVCLQLAFAHSFQRVVKRTWD